MSMATVEGSTNRCGGFAVAIGWLVAAAAAVAVVVVVATIAALAVVVLLALFWGVSRLLPFVFVVAVLSPSSNCGLGVSQSQSKRSMDISWRLVLESPENMFVSRPIGWADEARPIVCVCSMKQPAPACCD